MNTWKQNLRSQNANPSQGEVSDPDLWVLMHFGGEKYQRLKIAMEAKTNFDGSCPLCKLMFCFSNES